MKLSYLSVLCGITWLATSRVAVAAPDASVPTITLPNPNGFDLLVKAGEIYARGTEGEPMASQRLTAGENLNAQRSSVRRNQKSLEMLRQGLQLPVVHPPIRNEDQGPDYDDLRVLARLLKQESSVKSAAQDWSGALNSQLDAVQMGVAITRGGGVRAIESGLSIESLGRLGVEAIAPRLSAPEALESAARLQKIESQRPSFVEIVNAERATALSLTQFSMEQKDWENVITGVPDEPEPDPNAANPDAANPNFDPQNADGEAAPAPDAAPEKEAPKSPFTPQEIAQLRNLGLSDIQNNLARYYETVLVNARAPYNALKRISPASDPWSRFLTQDIADPLIRLSYEAARTQNLLLRQALILSAAKLNSGAYPAALELPTDPFNPGQTLVYKRTDTGYLLYSVGPDGKDDGGTPTKLQTYKRDTDAGAVSSGLSPDSKGDILAPVF